MSDVSVIGLGTMGSAIAKALMKSGKKVTVWNRSQGCIQPLVEEGASGAASLAQALDASPTVFKCVDKQESVKPLFASPDLQRRLAGRTIIDLSTGLPQGSRDLMAF